MKCQCVGPECVCNTITDLNQFPMSCGNVIEHVTSEKERFDKFVRAAMQGLLSGTEYRSEALIAEMSFRIARQTIDRIDKEFK